MSTLKQIDELIQDAGVDNLGSFLHNLAMMFDQELAALKGAAEENAAINHRCPECGTSIVEPLDSHLHLYVPANEGKPYYNITFKCPFCSNPLSAHVLLVNVERLPF